MFDKLIEILSTWANEILPFIIIPSYEEGVVLRMGKYNKMLKEGIHFKIPFFDNVLTHHTVMTTLSLPAQSLYTIDNQNIVVKGVVKYKIADVKTFLLEVYDAKDAISDMTQSIIKNIITNKTVHQCLHEDIDNMLTKKSRVEIRKWGVDVQQVTLTDLAPIRSFRIINDVATNIID
jgi:regulator of protease activity HflC (stomatin/prohibitin superfamily)